MNYPTRTWRELNRTFFKMYHCDDGTDFLENDSGPNFTNQITAVCQSGGLIATAFKPNEIIQVTGRATTYDIEEARRTVMVYNQKLSELCSIPISSTSLILHLCWTKENKLCVISLDGEILIYDIRYPNQPAQAFNVPLPQNARQVSCHNYQIGGCQVAILFHYPQNNKFTQFVILDELPSSPEITHYQFPSKITVVSFCMIRYSRPGTVQLDGFKQAGNFCNGDVSILVLVHSGGVFKLGAPKDVGQGKKEQLQDIQQVAQLKCPRVSSTSQIRVDPSGQFVGVLVQTGCNYVSAANGFWLKETYLCQLAESAAKAESMAGGQEEASGNLQFQSLNFPSEQAQKHFNQLDREEEVLANLELYRQGVHGQLHIFDATMQHRYAEILVKSSQPMSTCRLYWVGDSTPAVVYKQGHECKCGLFGLEEQHLTYRICSSNQTPLVCEEIDGLRFISPGIVDILKPINPLTCYMFHERYATSEPAHLLESYLAFEQNSYEGDSLARNLEARGENLYELLLGVLCVAEDENTEEYSELIYHAVRYFKLFTADERTESNIDQLNNIFCAQNIDTSNLTSEEFTAGFIPYLECIISGQNTNIVYNNKEVVTFLQGGRQVVIDVATGENTGQFRLRDYLTDFYCLSMKLRVLKFLLCQNGIFCTVPEIKHAGINSIINLCLILKMFSLSMKVCKLFGLSSEDVVLDFIKQLIINNEEASDRRLLGQIIKKKQISSQLQYKRVAFAVAELNRYRLARLLLEKEPSIESKVELNLKIGDYYSAIKVALKGGDVALAHNAIELATEDTEGLNQLIALINEDKVVNEIFFQLNKLVKPDLLYSLGNSSEPQNYVFLAESQYRKARNSKNVKNAIQFLEDVKSNVKEASEQHKSYAKALKHKKFDDISFKIRQSDELQQIKMKVESLLDEYEEIDGEMVAETEQECYENSLLSFDYFDELIQQELELVELEKELNDKFNCKGLTGATCFDTLAFLYQKQLIYMLVKESKQDLTAEEEEKIFDCSQYIHNIIRKLNVSFEVELSSYLKALSSNEEFYVKLLDLTKSNQLCSHNSVKLTNKQNQFMLYVLFQVSKMLNSITAAGEYASMIENAGLKFRCYLMIREDQQLVGIYRQLGIQKLQEMVCEFYGHPGVASVIERLVYELEISSLSAKENEEALKGVAGAEKTTQK